MTWRIDDPQGEESAKIAPFIVPYTRGRGLDLGCGFGKAFPHFIGMDSGKDYGQPVADITGDCSDLSLFADYSQDFVFSSHLLEHIEDTAGALFEWWRVIRPGGHLVLYLPHKYLYPNIGEEGANPDHDHDFLPGDIIEHMRETAQASGHGWDMIENEDRDQGREYSFFLVFKKHAEAGKDAIPRCYERPWRRPEKSCLVIRYGAFGDHIMASSVLPKLKAQGYHITYNCEPRGQEVLRENPHIDAWWIQDTDQVPNQVLGPYWTRLAERYDAVFNLSESIEGVLLSVEGRFNYGWPDAVRRRVMGGVNYMDRTHDLCDVDGPAEPAFHATAKELMWARKTKAKLTKKGQHPVILWALSGSSRHKTWPWLDNALAGLMQATSARVVLAGGMQDKVLELGWEEEPRVLLTAGEWTIRQTLAFAQVADIVVGPETGLLNAVSMLPGVAKVIYLSHSSHENLTRDWINTTVLLPGVGCYPCHRLHYPGAVDCPKHEESHTAICAASIEPEKMLEAIAHHLNLMKVAA